MSTWLLDNDFHNNLPAGNSGTRTCQPGPGTVVWSVPNGSAPTTTSEGKSASLVFSDAATQQQQFALKSYFAASGSTVKAGVAAEFRLWISRLSEPFTITADGFNVFVFTNGSSGTFFAASNFHQQVGVSVSHHDFGATSDGLTVASNYLDIRIVVRKLDPVSGTLFVVETFVNYFPLAPWYVSLGTQILALTNGAFIHYITGASAQTGGSNTIQLISQRLNDNFDLDPIIANNRYIAPIFTTKYRFGNGTYGGGCIPSGYARAPSGVDLLLCADALSDGGAPDCLRLFTQSATVPGLAGFLETTFTGHDYLGNASTSLGLFDLDATATAPVNVVPVLNLVRTSSGLNSLTVTGGVTGTDNSQVLSGGQAFWNVLPSATFLASATINQTAPTGGGGNAPCISVDIPSGGGGTISACLCNYDSSNYANGYVGTLVAGTSVGTVTASSASTCNIPIASAAATITLNAGAQYVIVIFNGSATAYVPSGGLGTGYAAFSGVTSASFSSSVSAVMSGYSPGFGGGAYKPAARIATTVAPYASAILTQVPQGTTLVIGDSSGSGVTQTYGVGGTSLGGTVATAITALTANLPSGWTASLGPGSVYSSTPGTTSLNMLPPQIITCNVAGGANLVGGLAGGAQAIAAAGDGSSLAICERWMDGHTIMFTGRFGAAPYTAAANWGSEFSITGTPANLSISATTSPPTAGTYVYGGTFNSHPYWFCAANGCYIFYTFNSGDNWNIYTSLSNVLVAGYFFIVNKIPIGSYSSGGGTTGTPVVSLLSSTGGDQDGYGDMQLMRLADGRWLILCTFNASGAAPNITRLVSSPLGSTNTQLAASLPIESSGTLWSKFDVALNGSDNPALEPRGCQLANGSIFIVGRTADYALCSLVTISGSTFTAADPTGNASSVWCTCDGGVNVNTNQRPLIWAGNSPLSVVADNANGLVYVIQECDNGSTSGGRGAIKVLVAKQKAIASGSFDFADSSYGRLINRFGIYPCFQLVNGSLRGTMGVNTGAMFAAMPGVGSGGGSSTNSPMLFW